MSKTISESKSSNIMILLIVYLLMNDATDIICYKTIMIKNKSGTLCKNFNSFEQWLLIKTIMIKNKSGTLIEKFD